MLSRLVKVTKVSRILIIQTTVRKISCLSLVTRLQESFMSSVHDSSEHLRDSMIKMVVRNIFCNRKMWSQCFWISVNVRQEYYTLLNALALTSQCRNNIKNHPMQRIRYSSIYTYICLKVSFSPEDPRKAPTEEINKWTQVQKFFRESLKSVKCKVCCH